MKPAVERNLSLKMFLWFFFFVWLVGFTSTVCFLLSGMKAA